jgi:hypothetical protein
VVGCLGEGLEAQTIGRDGEKLRAAAPRNPRDVDEDDARVDLALDDSWVSGARRRSAGHPVDDLALVRRTVLDAEYD